MVYANAGFTPNNYKNYENTIKTSKPVRANKETTLIISVLPHASFKVTSITKTQMVLYHQNGQRET